ncbi:YraN family protein [Bariatricus sp. SGI.154]|uniref:YraN family protein n=1 Tax=Bariatricus sp. SGI.154 TaxID=3420549 RepID=UPI003CFFD08C
MSRCGYSKNRREIGTQYERKAGEHLKEKGYEILEYNYRCKVGEIDMIARDGGCLVFCEVKYRSGSESGHPAEAVDYKKQRVISKCALYYLTTHGLTDAECRFDVVSIEGEQITVYQNAFDYIGG